jgi:hypothetical protein
MHTSTHRLSTHLQAPIAPRAPAPTPISIPPIRRPRPQEFWYNDFKPYVHYIPLSYDGSDLLEKIQWAREHDAEVQQIVANARAFAEESFTDENIACFVYRLLSEYGQAQMFSPKLTAEFEKARVKYSYSRFNYLSENSDFECKYFNNE